MFLLSSSKLISLKDFSPRKISPLSISISLNIDYTIELLPAPVLPTIPSLIPSSTLKLTSFNAN